jgi:hypothetical protein
VKDATTTRAPKLTRRPMPSNFQRFGLRRDRLPEPADFYGREGLALRGQGAWRDALCPFHADTRPSLRVFIQTGAFRCMTCGAHGADVLAFSMLRHRVTFIEAAKALGAWEVAR